MSKIALYISLVIAVSFPAAGATGTTGAGRAAAGLAFAASSPGPSEPYTLGQKIPDLCSVSGLFRRPPAVLPNPRARFKFRESLRQDYALAELPSATQPPPSAGSSPRTPPGAAAPPAPQPDAPSTVALKPAVLLRNFVQDQKAIFTSPLHIRKHDVGWLTFLGLVGGVMLGTDGDLDAVTEIGANPATIRRSNTASNAGLAGLGGLALGIYATGLLKHDDHARETGLLTGEALADGLVAGEILKLATQRRRPLSPAGRGDFFRGGDSFPSDHAVLSWAMASVIAHEYPGWLTQASVYGTAAAVSLARVSAKQHFPADVIAGSALGYFIGRQVYNAHHDPDLGGASIGRFSKDPDSPEPGARVWGSRYVELDSWVYPALQRLSALGFIPIQFAGLQPWARSECARQVLQAMEIADEADSEPSPQVTGLIARLKDEFAVEIAAVDGDKPASLGLESVYFRDTAIAGRPLRDSFHFGQTIINDFGRPYWQGNNVVTGFSSFAESGRFTFHLRGEYQHAPSVPPFSPSVRALIATIDNNAPPSATASPEVNQFRLLDSYVAINVDDFQISFGKQSLWWGPGRSGPFLFSNNAEPPYMFRINRITPFQLPGILSYLGWIRGEFFLGKLSGHQFPARPFINGQKLSFQLTPNLEVGFSKTGVFAGVGSALTVGTFLRSVISVSSTNAQAADPRLDPGDRKGGFDFRYKVPGLRNWLTLYNDSFADDDPSPLASPRRSSMNPGIYLARVPGIPKLDLRLESVNTDVPAYGGKNGQFIYYNFRYHDSYLNKGNFLGSWIGRQSRGLQGWSTYWFTPQNKLEMSFRSSKINKDFIPQGGTQTDISAHAEFIVRPQWQVSGRLQFERWDIPVLGPVTHDVTTAIQFTYWPRLRFSR